MDLKRLQIFLQKKGLQNQAAVIAAFMYIKYSLGLNPFIGFLTNSATDAAQNIISTNAPITKVQSLADKFRVCVTETGHHHHQDSSKTDLLLTH
jgi:hypothetical protein